MIDLDNWDLDILYIKYCTYDVITMLRLAYYCMVMNDISVD